MNHRMLTVFGSIPGGASPPGGFDGPPPDMRRKDVGRAKTRSTELRLTIIGRNEGATTPWPKGPMNDSEGAS